MRRQQLRGRWGTALAGLVFALLLSGCLGSGGGDSPAPAPRLAVDKTTLDFGEAVSMLSLRISNAGGGRLTWSITVDQDWLGVEPSSGENAGTVTVSVDRAKLEPGQHGGSLTIASNGGTATVTVLVTAVESGGGAAPGKVQDLDARGFTLPASLRSAGVNAYSPSKQAQWLLELAHERDAAAMFAPSDTPAGVVRTAMPEGYEGVFALSWRAEPAATGYRIYFDTGAGWQHKDVGVDDLEDPSQPTFLISGNFDVGTQAKFAVQAFSGDEFGEASDEDSAVIIAPQYLSQPANGFQAPRRPTFEWKEHPNATAYIVFLTAGELSNHVWVQVVEPDVVRVTYPHGDDNAPQELEAGAYAWFVTTQGPFDAAQRADAYAVSAAWTFTVE